MRPKRGARENGMKVGVIGAGAMGARHARTVAAHPSTSLAAVVDHSLSRARAAASLATGACDAATTPDELDRCDAVIVATSTCDHADVAVRLLSRGIPVLVEKPLALTPYDCVAIIECSVATGTPVMCGFVERFNSAWLSALLHIDAEPTDVDAIRESPPVLRPGSGVVSDVMIHDLDLASLLFAGDAVRGRPVLEGELVGPDSVRAEIDWGRDRRSRLFASRDASERRRMMRIETEAGWMEADLLTEELRIGRHGRSRQLLMDCRSAETSLHRQLSHFAALVEGDVDPVAERASITRTHELAFDIERAVVDSTSCFLTLEA